MNTIRWLINKYKDARQRSLNKKEFKEMLILAVSGGRISQESIAELDKKKKNLGLNHEDISEMKVEVYEAAFSSLKRNGILTAKEEHELENVQKYLLIQDIEIQEYKRDIARFRLLDEIIKGNLPTVSVTNVILQNNEVVHWVESASLLEEKVVRRRFEGGSQGVSIRIAKGLSYRVGGFGGHSVSETGMVITSTGEFVITNKRFIFRGNKKSFAVKYDKVLDIQFYMDGMQFSEVNRSKPRIISYAFIGNQEIVRAIISSILDSNTRGENIESSRDTEQDFIKSNSELDVAWAYVNHGDAKKKVGNLEGAIDDYDKAIELDPKFVDSYSRRGDVKFELKNFTGAIEDYDKAIELDPEDSWAYICRGDVKEELGDLSGAIQDYDNALDINSEDAWALCSRANAKFGLEDYIEAIQDLNKAIRIEPNNPMPYSRRGDAKKSLEDYSGAIQDYSKSIELNPSNAWAYYSRGRSKGALGDHTGEVQDFDKAIEIDPTYTAMVYRSLGVGKFQSGDYIGAIQDLNKAIELEPDNAWPYSIRGLAKKNLEDYTEAINDLNMAIELDPENAMYYLYRGNTKAQVGDKEGALLDLSKSGELGESEAYEVIRSLQQR